MKNKTNKTKFKPMKIDASKILMIWIFVLIAAIGLPSVVYSKGIMDGGNRQEESENEMRDFLRGTETSGVSDSEAAGDSQSGGGISGFFSRLFGSGGKNESSANNNSTANASGKENSGSGISGFFSRIFGGGKNSGSSTEIDDDDDIMGIFSGLFGGSRNNSSTEIDDDDEDIMGILSGLFGGGGITPPPVTPPPAPASSASSSGGSYTVENTSGKLTYSRGGIPSKYNGKYIIAVIIDMDAKESLFASGDVNSRFETITGAQISNGGAVLKVWRTSDDGNLLNFNGRGSYLLMTYVMDKGTTSKADWDKAIENPMNNGLFFAADVMGSVSFSSGSGTANTGMFIDLDYFVGSSN